MEQFGQIMNKYVNEILPLQDNSEGSSIPKQCEYYFELLQKNTNIKRIVEIGFNIGLSAASFLASRPDIEVISIDICSHDYVLKIKKVLDSYFPGRHTLICGDSTTAVPMLKRFFNGFVPVDLFFVDGYHRDPVPRLDILNALEWCGPDSFIIIDDVCPTHGSEGVVQAVISCAEEKKINIIQHIMCADRGWVLAKKL
jgi:predicted O-methyltransferase YrrM